MLRAICARVLAPNNSVLASSTLLRCSRVNYCTKEGDDDAGHMGQEAEQARKEASFCHVNMLGRLGQNPQEITAKNGKFVTFNVAVKSLQGARWHQVKVNNLNTQEWLINYVQAGDRVYIRGSLSYSLDENGMKRYSIAADSVSLINKSRKNQQKMDEDSGSDVELEQK